MIFQVIYLLIQMANAVVETPPHFPLFASTNFSISKEEDEANIVGNDEKWLKFYSSSHQILLVGEGDFSFSLCLAKAFCSASNMLATSLDCYDYLINKYKNAKPNLEQLDNLGASLLHCLDATKMMSHPHLRSRKFDRIIFNFPHAGFYGREDDVLVVEMHRNLVDGFLRNARGMLRAGGEIHINHKITAPFCLWNLHELAEKNDLTVIVYDAFRIEDYPGYSNKRGSGSECDEPFPLGPCCTFKFTLMESISSVVAASSEETGRGEVRRIKYYSSSEKILLVGEGDFSFAVCLAKAFGSATNMVATSLDSEAELIWKHPNAGDNVSQLKGRGCTVIHGVDACTMTQHPDLLHHKFDKIVFNFPHGGFTTSEHSQFQIELHWEVVRGFLRSAGMMLGTNGEVHITVICTIITHKTTYPFSWWEIVELGEEEGLVLVEKARFSLREYPGYQNKRGAGAFSNRTFPVGASSTLIFRNRSSTS